ncbi:MAG: TolC family protein [Deltaproteobacteria bacterium]|nr:TolC family protein [Deltaproteobacteria bacterium]
MTALQIAAILLLWNGQPPTTAASAATTAAAATATATVTTTAAHTTRTAATRDLETRAETRAETVLQLSDAIEIASALNEVPQMAEARVARARAVRREAWAQLFPRLVASGSYTRRTETLSREITPGQTIVMQQKNALAGNITLSVDVVDARALAALSATGHSLESESYEAQEAKRLLSFEVAETFYASVLADLMVEAAQHRLDATHASVDEATARLQAGLAARNEATRTELELASAELSMTDAKSNLESTHLALEYLLGERLNEREPHITLSRDFSVPSQRPAELVEVALAERLDLRALVARRDEIDVRRKIPLLAALPRVGVQGVLTASNEVGFSGKEVDGIVQGLLTWELFDGGSRYAERDALSAELEIAQLTLQAMRRQVRLEVEQSVLQYRRAYAAHAQAETRHRIAKINAEEVRVLFSGGLSTALERVDSLLAEFEAELEVARTKIGLLLAELGIRHATGASAVLDP